MLIEDEVRALERARTVKWVERKLRNRMRYVRRVRRFDPSWGFTIWPGPVGLGLS